MNTRRALSAFVVIALALTIAVTAIDCGDDKPTKPNDDITVINTVTGSWPDEVEGAYQVTGQVAPCWPPMWVTLDTTTIYICEGGLTFWWDDYSSGDTVFYKSDSLTGVIGDSTDVNVRGRIRFKDCEGRESYVFTIHDLARDSFDLTTTFKDAFSTSSCSRYNTCTTVKLHFVRIGDAPLDSCPGILGKRVAFADVVRDIFTRPLLQ